MESTPRPSPGARGLWSSKLGWAAYLACSWTWCIGMFLPVLLVRDFGIWGFVVFAVPNVLGAGAMGWVLRNQEVAKRITTEHRFAVRAFSEVTWLFQMFFLVALLQANKQDYWVLLVAFGSIVLGWIVCSRRSAQAGAVLQWLISAGLFAFLLVKGEVGLPSHTDRAVDSGLLWLAPVCAFGFGLCPYLDATFLKARESQRDARFAFGFGFVVLFFAMIVFTLLYAKAFDLTTQIPAFANVESVLATAVTIHIVSQIGFTTYAHGRAIPGEDSKRAARNRGAIGALSAVLTTFIAKMTIGETHSGLSITEVIYRLFMSFYGLIFPAYVWLCMIPIRGERFTLKPTRAKWTILAIAVTLAAPCYWMGFIERQTIWLGPGLLFVLLARLLVPKSTSVAAASSDPHTA